MSEIARLNMSYTELADMPDLEARMRAGMPQNTNFSASDASISPSRNMKNIDRQYS